MRSACWGREQGGEPASTPRTKMRTQAELSLCFDFDARATVSQLAKFSAYGFLKNQQYYTPFWLLYFRSEGLSFSEFGLLMAWDSVIVNLWDVPAGAIADAVGRRRTLVFSFALYVGAFVGFTFVDNFKMLFIVFAFFSGGEAFRGGTHKAMILEWLKLHGRLDLKLQVYGYTRSWSKIGSAVSSLIGGGVVAVLGGYRYVFLMSIALYMANALNVMSYPSALDGDVMADISLRKHMGNAASILGKAVKEFRNPAVPGFIMEAMLFQGSFRCGKDYMQPLLHILAMQFGDEGDTRVTGAIVGCTYFGLFIVSSVASRRAHSLVDRFESQHNAAGFVWIGCLGLYSTLAVALSVDSVCLATVCFFGLYFLQNTWRPLLISRLTSSTDQKVAATILSAEAQAAGLFGAAYAPLLGFAVQHRVTELGASRPKAFLIMPLMGVAVSVLGLCVWRSLSSRAAAVPREPSLLG